MKLTETILCWCIVMSASLATVDNVHVRGQDPPVPALDPSGHVGRVWDLGFTPDGSRLVTVSYDKTIRVWDVRTGEPLQTLRPPAGPGLEGRLVCGSLSPDGDLVAVAGTGVPGSLNAVYVVSLKTGRMEKVLQGHTANVNVVAFSPDGQLIASGGHDLKLHVWDVATGQKLGSHAGHSGYINLLAFSPDSRRIVTASADKTARLWDVATGQTVQTLTHDATCLAVAVSPSGGLIATGTETGTVTLWDAEGQVKKRWQPLFAFDLRPAVTSLQFLAEQRLVFTTTPGGFGVIDMTTEAIRLHPSNEKEGATGCAVSPDGRIIVTGNPSGSVQAWDAETGMPIRKFGGRSRPISAVAWSPEGTQILWAAAETSNSIEAEWNAFDIPNLRIIDTAQGHDGPFDKRMMMRPGRFGAIHERGSWRLEKAGSITVVALKDGERTHEFSVLIPGTGSHSASSFTLVDDNHAAIGTGNGNVLVFELESGRLVRELRGHVGEVTSLAPSPDGKLLLSGSNDHSLAIWRLDDIDPLLQFFAAGQEWVLWSPRGLYAASVGGERLIGWHVGRGPEQMARFLTARQMRLRLFRPKLIVELFRTRNWELASQAADLEQTDIDLRNPKSLARLLPPDVTIITPEPGATIDGQSVDIVVEITSVEAEVVNDAFVLVNGRRSGDVQRFDEQGRIFLRGQVTLTNPTNTITAIASNANSCSDPATVEVYKRGLDEISVRDLRLSSKTDPTRTADDRQPPAGRMLALCIGVSTYVRDDLNLRYAHSDALEFARVLPTVAGPLFEDIVPRVLIDKSATREAVLDGFDWLVAEARTDDVVVLFLAGHGLRDTNDNYYFAPHDVDPDRVRSTAVRWSDLVGAIRDIRGKVIVFADTCHAGALTGARAVENDPIRDLIGENVGAVVFSSAAPWQLAEESAEWQHGAFTKALLETLTESAHDMDRPPDGRLSILELEFHMTRKVRMLTAGRQQPIVQKPPTIRDFDFVSVSTPGESWKDDDQNAD